MFKSDIRTILTELAKERKFFLSEADFQFALAWKIHLLYPNADIRLESPQKISISRNLAYVDIWVELDGKAYPIELKYKTRSYKAKDANGDEIKIKTHSAQDTGRHGYLKDIERIEHYRAINGFERGFAIMLTNDKHYYDKEKKRPGTNDANFLVHEGATVKGGKTLTWKNPQEWTKKYPDITLCNDYSIHWEEYNSCDDGNGDFMYTITEIIQSQSK